MINALGTVLRWIFTPFIALFLLFEEWGWEPLAALLQRLARMPVWAWCERKITQLPPWGALLVLLVPAVALFPIKLLALLLLRHGQFVLGFTVLIAAKLIGTALVARLFQLTQPALMQFAWFAHWYPRWKAWKDRLMDYVRASAVWQLGKRFKARAKDGLRYARKLWHQIRHGA
jgi:hypothetical protein